MNIYIDEAGVFLKPSSNKSAISTVGALIIPEDYTEKIFQEFEDIKASWGYANSEIKGSKLNENQISDVAKILNKYDVVFEVIAIDMNIQDNAAITAHKMDRAKKMTDCITDEFNTTLIDNLHKTRREIEALSNQLYIQVQLTIHLLIKILQKTTLYYSTRLPHELEFFNWLIDAKNNNITTSEKLWSSLVLPIAQSESFKNPLIVIKEGDYSYFHKSRKVDQVPNYLKPHIGDKPPSEFTELNTIFNENLHFEDSKNDLGLQLSDILTSAIRRSMNGNLQKAGWKDIGQIMLMGETQTITLMNMSEYCDDSVYTIAPPYYDVIEYIDKVSKSIFLD